MKKKVLFLLIPLLLAGLSGCVKYNGQPKSTSKEKITPSSAQPINYSVEPEVPPAPHGAGEETPVSPDVTSVKIYLVFGVNGKLDGNLVNDKVEDADNKVYLEHTKTITANVGSDLPGKDRVTSSVEKSTFVAWTAYNNDGKLTEYTTVPAVNGKILYASFTGGSGGPHSGSSGQSQGGGEQGGGSQGGGESQNEDYPGSTAGTLPTTGFGLVFSDGTYMAAIQTDNFGEYLQYYITKRSFRQGQAFTLYDFGNSAAFLAKEIDEYSFGKKVSEYLATDETNHRYSVLKDFNAEYIYLKFKENQDQIYIELAH